MPSGARAESGNSMIKVVFDANVLVSAFLSRNNPRGVSNELLRFARRGVISFTSPQRSSPRSLLLLRKMSGRSSARPVPRPWQRSFATISSRS